ncbi:hypothetical protein [Litchfieldia salsa]|uniref:Replication protein n=1 Tax=Litchfieldia salsa TaxID=930152 RepID=A0A1H0W6H8_9BACI|nr:hypothetical protein [Litchfieldia salsa]SDP86193.1 hypothetical protein SAMN05216565_109114 [Litchfieldia salsa]
MAKYRMVRTDFWMNPMVSEEMTPEDRYFWLYLHTTMYTSQYGIYKITRKAIAFDMGYSIETVNVLMDRLMNHLQLIRYNPQTREIAIKYWGNYNLHKGGKPIQDCLLAELQEVDDTSLISYVANHIKKDEILAIYKCFCTIGEEGIDLSEEENHDTIDETLTTRTTIGGQKEKEKEKENKKQQQENLNLSIEFNPKEDIPIHNKYPQQAKEIYTYNNVQFSKQKGDQPNECNLTFTSAEDG